MAELIDKWELLKHDTHAKNFSPEMLVVGKGYIMDAKIIEIPEINYKLYRVKRPDNNKVWEELGYNEVIVCASNENQAKGIALANCDLLQPFGAYEINKKQLIVEELNNLKVGDVICKN